MSIRGEWYFPWQIKLVGAVMGAISVPLLGTSILLALTFIVVCVLIFTMHYGVQVDREKKTYREYLWVLGWKNGRVMPMPAVDYLFVKPNKVTRTHHARIKSMTVTNTEYDGYLRLSEQVKIHVFSSPHQKEVIAKLRPLKTYLQTRIVDYSGEVPTEV